MTSELGDLAFVCSPYHRGGVTRWMVDMAVAWSRRGGDAWFVAPHPKARFVNAGQRPTVLELLGAQSGVASLHLIGPDVDARFEFGTTVHRAMIYAAALREGVRASVPVIVSDDAAVWAAGASLADRNPLIGVLHSGENGYYELASRYCHAAAALVCVSRRIERATQAKVGPAAPFLSTIPCGTPLPSPDRAPGRGSHLRLAWVGRIEEAPKRVSDLPRIASALRAAGVVFCLDIVGDGPDLSAMMEATLQLGLAEYVRFHGWLPAEKVGMLLSSTDVLLLPSNYEGMPIVVMEALARGCAVVASRVSGIEDYEDHPSASQCLLLHGVGDVESATAQVRRLCEVDPQKRAAAARALAEREFSIDVCVDRYARVAVSAALATRRQPTALRRSAFAEIASLAVATQRTARIWVRTQLSGQPRN